MEKYFVNITVYNRVGVLYRITALFSRLQINITSLALENGNSEDKAKVILGFSCDSENKKLLVNRLLKIYDVCTVEEKA